MIYTLVIVLIILIVISGILLRNRFTFEALSDKQLRDNLQAEEKLPLISVCIPARNEEKNIKRCLQSLLNQGYPSYEILVLNDCSEDKTGEIIKHLQNRYSDKITSLDGLPKPDDWLGKPWACHQLSRHANGEYILFVDADTWFEPTTLSDTLRRFRQYNLDFITVWPHQELGSFWENIIIPMLYYVLLGFLITDYVTDLPGWLPKSIHPLVAPFFAAADGQFIGFRKKAYHAINGHTAVKSNIVEDVELSRIIRKKGLRMRMFHGMESVHCRMYASYSEIKIGFQKNFLAGFDHNIPLFLSAAVFHLFVYIFPILTFFYGILSGSSLIIALSLLAIIIPIIQRFILAEWFSQNLSYSFLHVLGVLWFEWLGVITLYIHLFNRPLFWKNRKL